MGDGTDWLKVRGIGRERFAGFLAEFLESAGFRVERADTTEPAESWVRGQLARMNPAVPDGGREVAVRVYPTSGGAAAAWTHPTTLAPGERARMDRFVREFVAHVERAVMTGTHATAKVSRPPGGRLPWEA
jgi:hypothetical protein